MTEEPTWADKVVRLCEDFYQKIAEPQQITDDQLQSAINIAQLFKPPYRLPIAANLIAAFLPKGRRRHSTGICSKLFYRFAPSSCSIA